MFKFYEMVSAVQNYNFDKFRNDTRGVTALEYGLIAALIGGVIVAGVTLLGGNVGGTFSSIAGKVKATP